MLKKLDIRNFTLIDHLEMMLYPGFSVITGETGAGKSIVIGAIGLLLGNRADAKQVKRGCDKCIIEATFDLSIYHSDVLKGFFEENDLDYEPEECLLRREVNANGKSRAFINDTPVTLALMRELGEQLIDVHSQHQNLLLSKEDFQLNVVDIIARDRQQLADYRAAFAELRSAQHRLDELREQIATSRDNEDFLRFQQKELSEAKLTLGEQEQLEQESELMSHAEDIKRALHDADYGLSGDDTGDSSRTATGGTAS
jgi:DNA repair protein RecN (Recombination protein N)